MSGKSPRVPTGGKRRQDAMTVDEMLGAIEAMRLQAGWKEPTPKTDRLRDEALHKVASIEAKVRAATTMRTMQRLQRELDDVLPAYYRGLAGLQREGGTP